MEGIRNLHKSEKKITGSRQKSVLITTTYKYSIYL